jgi:hypothetical protein
VTFETTCACRTYGKYTQEIRVSMGVDVGLSHAPAYCRICSACCGRTGPPLTTFVAHAGKSRARHGTAGPLIRQRLWGYLLQSISSAWRLPSQRSWLWLQQSSVEDFCLLRPPYWDVVQSLTVLTVMMSDHCWMRARQGAQRHLKRSRSAMVSCQRADTPKGKGTGS